MVGMSSKHENKWTRGKHSRRTCSCTLRKRRYAHRERTIMSTRVWEALMEDKKIGRETLVAYRKEVESLLLKRERRLRGSY